MKMEPIAVEENRTRTTLLEGYLKRLEATYPDEIGSEALTSLRQRLARRKNQDVVDLERGH